MKMKKENGSDQQVPDNKNNDIKLIKASTIRSPRPKQVCSVKSKTNVSDSKPRSWVFKFTNCIESEEDNKALDAIKAGPKKSHEWSLFRSQNNRSKSNSAKMSHSDTNDRFC